MVLCPVGLGLAEKKLKLGFDRVDDVHLFRTSLGPGLLEHVRKHPVSFCTVVKLSKVFDEFLVAHEGNLPVPKGADS